MRARLPASAQSSSVASLLLPGCGALFFLCFLWSHVRQLALAHRDCVASGGTLADLAESQDGLVQVLVAHRQPSQLADAFKRVLETWQQSKLASAKAQLRGMMDASAASKVEGLLDELASSWRDDALVSASARASAYAVGGSKWLTRGAYAVKRARLL